MGYKEVYRVLREVFPQVDTRIVKAVSLEHSNDIDSAVEFIIREVVSSSGPTESSSGPAVQKTDDPSIKGCEVADQSKIVGQGPSESSYSLQESDLSLNDRECKTVEVRNENTDGSCFAPISDSNVNDSSPFVDVANLILSEHNSAASLTSESQVDSDQGNQDTMIMKTDDVSALEAMPVASNQEPLANVSGSTFSAAYSDGVVVRENGSHVVGYGTEVYNNLLDIFGEEERFYASSLDPSTVLVDKFFNSMSHHALSSKFVPAFVPENVSNYRAINPENIGSYCGTSVQAVGCVSVNDVDGILDSHSAADNANSQCATVSCSNQVISVELLEDFINDAKNNKKVLSSAIEATRSMMKEVDIEEEKARKAKEEASQAGADILMKLQEMRQSMENAKEANNMHAGEVHGEKSILAAESRELQSRILAVSNERDKALGVIEEIQKTLEGRLAVAKQQIESAMEEKLERERLAKLALSEHEAVMESIVQEAKKLQEAAEENAKLREFLFERGRMVDILQGEISVISEDILVLKKCVDGQLLPFSCSLLFRPGSFSSSLSSSLQKSCSSAMTNDDHHQLGVLMGNSVDALEESIGYDGEKALVAEKQEDDWEVVQ